MKKERLQFFSTAEEIDRLIYKHQQVSRIYRTRAMDPYVLNRADLIQIADFLDEKARGLREESHRFGPADRVNVIATAEARLEAARRHLAKIDRGFAQSGEPKKFAA